MNDDATHDTTGTEDIGYYGELIESIRDIGSTSPLLDRWRPVPEEQMHRGRHLAVAAHSPAPDVISMAACDDRGMSAVLVLSIWDTNTIIGLLQKAVEAADARPHATGTSG